MKKIFDLHTLSKKLKYNDNIGEIVVHCHGVFDLLHIGHVKYFQEAKAMGDVLIVTLTPDRFIKKGPIRPIFNENLRAEMIAALDVVDYVAINDWPTAIKTIKILKTDLYVKGPDYKDYKQDVTGNMVVLSGAKLVLVDVDPNTLTIDPSLIEEKLTNKTKAIIVVHQFSHAAQMDEIMSLAKKYGLKVIEDNAESIGGKYKGRLLGTIGDMSTFSFFGNKIITTGEGGAVLTNNTKVAIKCRELRDHGMNHKKKYHHTDLGYNYRMTNIQAAIGLAQMEKLDEILTLRKKQMDLYYNELSDVHGLSLRKFADWCDPVHWMMTITLDDNYDRDEFLNYMKGNGVDCRQMINPVHNAEHFKNQFADTDFQNSINISKQSAHLPSGLGLTEEEIIKISNIVKSFLT